MYDEKHRPQFHFTAHTNWLNDPNGLVYYQGEYHLFFQHNPSGVEWGNMTWGHAVSPDMVHWKQLDHAIYPDELGTIYSGSAVVDWGNTAGFQSGKEKTIVCIYTSAGGTSPDSKGQPFTQSIAYSNDCGRTFTKFPGNPVLKHIAGGNRDPKVIWHAPTKKWVMALYLDKSDYALLASSDLKQWTKLCDVNLPKDGECPDFFELPVDGKGRDTRWVFWGADGNYLLGAFDGKTFTSEQPPLRCENGANCYAAQTFSDIPAADGRRLQIAWMRGSKFPDMPFNQQMSFPRELTLRTTPDGVRLFINPAREIEKLHARKHSWTQEAFKAGASPVTGLKGGLLDIRAEIELQGAAEVGFVLHSQKVVYDVAKGELTALGKSAPLRAPGGKIRLQILLDRASIEVFGNGGQVSLASFFLPPEGTAPLESYCAGGEAKIVSMDVYELHSAWK